MAPTSTPHIMVDLETFASSNNAAIVSIGAVAFNPHTGEINPNTFYVIVDAASSQKAGMEVDADTVMWWFRQTPEARDQLTKADKLALKDAMKSFATWAVEQAGTQPAVWGNGATFDNIILRNAFKAVDVWQPWKYNRDYCYRTMKNMFPSVEFVRAGTHHNALDDAMTQTLHLIEIFNSIGLKPPQPV